MEEKEFKTGGYCAACLKTTSGCTCMHDNVTELPGIESIDIMMDLQYLTEKRDDALEHFNDGVKQYMSKKKLIERLDRVLRVNRQLKIMEGAVVISALARSDKRNK